MLCKYSPGFFPACLFALGAAQAAPTLLAIGTISGSSDLSGLTGTLENGSAANILGGIGSGLAWAGGNTFLAVPDRGPNATAYTGGSVVDNTTSYISRFHTLDLNLVASTSGGLPYSLGASLTGTTLLYSNTELNYGSTAGLAEGGPSNNSAGVNYFTGRSDGFAAGQSDNSDNARLDPEAIRVSNDGLSVFISDEYGPYVYQFDRATGKRIKTFTLPDHFAVDHLSSLGAAEISGNTTGRVANKGMEGLAITPDGKTLVGFMQSPLIQDGGDGGRANRIVTIDIATGQTKEYAYDNLIGTKAYNSSEIIALNDHQFMVLERDGKGLGDGSKAVVKQIFAVDIAGAQDVSGLSGQAALLAQAPSKSLFLDIASALKTFGIPDIQIPAKIEGLAFGQDITDNGTLYHTLYISNDNDFVSGIAGENKFYVFGFSDSDLNAASLAYVAQNFHAVPEPSTLGLIGLNVGLLLLVAHRRNRSKKIKS